jgi:hypothetical protein
VYLVEQQQVSRGKYIVKGGMSIEGPVPEHRRNDITLINDEEVKEVFRERNIPFIRSLREQQKKEEEAKSKKG